MAAPGASSPAPRRSGGGMLTQYFLFILMGFGLVTLWMNLTHEGIVNPSQMFQDQHFSVISFTQQRSEEQQGQEDGEEEDQQREEQEVEAPHKLAGLDCSSYGGPSNEIAKEMVYWSDIPSDNLHVSPFYDSQKFMTFEPDQGGWNNIRMSMETVLAMAVAMGRTLVLPPEQGMYLLDKDKGDKGKQRKHFSFNNFFHMESIANEHGGLNIITMDQFLEQEAMTGKLKDADGNVQFPPENRTDWNGRDRHGLNELKRYLRTVSHWPTWDPDNCMAGFAKDPKNLTLLKNLKAEIEAPGGNKTFMSPRNYEAYIGKPNPVDASPEKRMKENWAERKTICIYDEELQAAPLVHFGYDYGGKGARLLVHFYAFMFFEDWRQDLWMKRFIRDHVRYVDEIQCAAARIVNALRERARKRNPDSNGDFDAFHIRRGDFQYTVTRFEADKIYEVSKDMLTPNATVYIATDERNRTFFKPLADHYDIVFLDDFKSLIEDVNSNYYGMLDQLITSRSRIFFGCWFSTFTGYINRMRGYHNDKEKGKGHEMGIVPSYYYALEDRKLHMQTFYPVKKQFYAREFPGAWRDIDKGIGELTTATK